jgi:hypothetical protein
LQICSHGGLPNETSGVPSSYFATAEAAEAFHERFGGELKPVVEDKSGRRRRRWNRGRNRAGTVATVRAVLPRASTRSSPSPAGFPPLPADGACTMAVVMPNASGTKGFDGTPS